METSFAFLIACFFSSRLFATIRQNNNDRTAFDRAPSLQTEKEEKAATRQTERSRRMVEWQKRRRPKRRRKAEEKEEKSKNSNM